LAVNIQLSISNDVLWIETKLYLFYRILALLEARHGHSTG